jgi:hypothetical protein
MVDISGHGENWCLQKGLAIKHFGEGFLNTFVYTYVGSVGALRDV